MIRDVEHGYYRSGSPLPVNKALIVKFDAYPEAKRYLDEQLWKQGRILFISGPPRCGKTTLGLSIMKTAWESEPHRQSYWKEYDYLEDLRRLWRTEEMAQKLIHDPAVWTEHIEWERDFRNRKDKTLLFLDQWCEGYTQMQWHESEAMVRYRSDQGLASIVAVSDPFLGGVPDSLQHLLRDDIVITLDAWEPPDQYKEERWCPHCARYKRVDEDDACLTCGTST